jgi:hypothetical protein
MYAPTPERIWRVKKVTAGIMSSVPNHVFQDVLRRADAVVAKDPLPLPQSKGLYMLEQLFGSGDSNYNTPKIFKHHFKHKPDRDLQVGPVDD